MSELTEREKNAIIHAMERRFGRSAAGYTFSSIEEQVYRCTDKWTGAFVEARLGSLNCPATSTRRRGWTIKVLREERLCPITPQNLPVRERIRMSPVPKCLVLIGNLLDVSLISEGFRKAILRAGASPDNFPAIHERIRASSGYKVSSLRALETIQADPRWRYSQTQYAEAHCVSFTMGKWARFFITKLPGSAEALLEAYPDLSIDNSGFWVRFMEAA